MEAQQDENFQAWVHGARLRMDLEGVNNIIPGIPDNMFSDKALPIAEHTKERWNDKDPQGIIPAGLCMPY